MIRNMKIHFAAHWLFIFLFISCNDYQESIDKMKGRKFCLDVPATKKINDVNIGKGSLLLNDDMTFIIKNDSSLFSNITGTWDICCKGSGWSNYVFKPNDHIRQMGSSPQFEVKIGERLVSLVFAACN